MRADRLATSDNGVRRNVPRRFSSTPMTGRKRPEKPASIRAHAAAAIGTNGSDVRRGAGAAAVRGRAAKSAGRPATPTGAGRDGACRAAACAIRTIMASYIFARAALLRAGVVSSRNAMAPRPVK